MTTLLPIDQLKSRPEIRSCLAIQILHRHGGANAGDSLASSVGGGKIILESCTEIVTTEVEKRYGLRGIGENKLFQKADKRCIEE